MAARLPTELLDLIPRYATDGTLVRLSAVSHQIYVISTALLYASIPYISIPRTVKCLRTLSAKPELARLVYSFHFNPPLSSPILGAFYALLEHALWNMSALHELSLEINSSLTRPRISTQVSCRLTRLEIVLGHEEPYPISDFLSAQPFIEELTIACIPGSISALSPEALPALRILSASFWLLPILLPGRLKHLSLLTVLRDIRDTQELVLLGECLEQAGAPTSMELIIFLDITASPLGANIIPIGLTQLSQAAPFISKLGLRICKGQIRRDELKDLFPCTLPRFPNLRLLAVMFRALTSDVWPSQVQSIQPLSNEYSSPSDPSAYMVALFNNANHGWPPFKRFYTPDS